MGLVAPDAELGQDQAAMPVLWLTSTLAVDKATGDYSDEALARLLPAGRGRVLRSFGHDGDGVHWLLTRGGTALHSDPAYARYSHQLVLRNDGNRLRGLPRFDAEEFWHPPMVAGMMYALDTHSPHQGLPDPRLDPPKTVLKLVIAVDRDELIHPAQVWPLLGRLLHRELPESLDPGYRAAPRWSERDHKTAQNSG
jgi:hypothetical protein